MLIEQPGSARFRPLVITALLLLAGTAATFSKGASQVATTAPSPAGPSASGVLTRLQMRNVDFYVDPQIALRIRRLDGSMRSKQGGTVLFDDKSSYIIHIDEAEVGLTGQDLSLLLNKYVFNYPGAPLRKLSVSVSGSEIVQKGILRKVVDMPFEIRATLSVTPDGRIRMHPTRTEILGLHVDKLLDGLGLALDEVISLKKANGATLVGNDIYLTPDKILPPPAIEGRVTAVRIEGNQIVQVFGSGSRSATMPTPDPAARNYQFYKGGTIRFGKLLMLDAEMLIVDLDPADPFRFELDRYQRQLVAGYSRTLPSGGLEVFMRDRDKIGKETLQITSVPTASVGLR